MFSNRSFRGGLPIDLCPTAEHMAECTKMNRFATIYFDYGVVTRVVGVTIDLARQDAICTIVCRRMINDGCKRIS